MGITGTLGPDLFINGHPIELGENKTGSGPAYQVMADAAQVKSPPKKVGTSLMPYPFELKIEGGAHLKNKLRWVLGWVPPPDDGIYRTFYAGKRRFSKSGIPTYWGYVEFNGEKHYGWVDEKKLLFPKKRKKHNKKMLSYAAYQVTTAKKIQRAWVYKRSKNVASSQVAVPVYVFIETTKPKKLYLNPSAESPALGSNNALRLVKLKDVNGRVLEGVTCGLRYAMKKWLLIQAPSDGEWYFIRKPPKYVERMIRSKPQFKLRPGIVLPKDM